MEALKLWARNGEAVRQALELGEIVHLETASEEITDEFLLFAIESGLLRQWAGGFPDPRSTGEVSLEVILAASVAARFAGIYSQRKTGYVLQSARVLGALGYSVEVLEEGDGITARGSGEDQLFSGDVLRKLLVKLEAQAKVGLPPEPVLVEAAAEVSPTRVRERASRRAVKAEVKEAEAEASGRAAAQALITWYNLTVAQSLLDYARLGGGRRIHILDATKVEVALETATYECAGVAKHEDGTLSRGYKLGTLRTLLDTAGVISQLAVGPMQMHDLELCRELLRTSWVLRAGDLLLEDRGFLDGGMITLLKRDRGVDVIIPLKANMHSYTEAVALANQAGQWGPHPTRPRQEIAFVAGVEHVWDECEVGLNACVIRFFNEKKRAIDHIVLVTTDLGLSAKWIVRHYEQRPEVEQDYEQLKSGGWFLKKLSSTRYSQIVFYLLTVVLSYSLYHLFAK